MSESSSLPLPPFAAFVLVGKVIVRAVFRCERACVCELETTARLFAAAAAAGFFFDTQHACGYLFLLFSLLFYYCCCCCFLCCCNCSGAATADPQCTQGKPQFVLVFVCEC